MNGLCFEHSFGKMENSISYISYISSNIQNELINIRGDLVQESQLLKIKKDKFFSILVHETQDISQLEQMSVCVRLHIKLHKGRFLTNMVI